MPPPPHVIPPPAGIQHLLRVSSQQLVYPFDNATQSGRYGGVYCFIVGPSDDKGLLFSFYRNDDKPGRVMMLSTPDIERVFPEERAGRQNVSVKTSPIFVEVHHSKLGYFNTFNFVLYSRIDDMPIRIGAGGYETVIKYETIDPFTLEARIPKTLTTY